MSSAHGFLVKGCERGGSAKRACADVCAGVVSRRFAALRCVRGCVIVAARGGGIFVGGEKGWGGIREEGVDWIRCADRLSVDQRASSRDRRYPDRNS